MENIVSVKITGDSSSLNTATGQADKGFQKLGETAKQTRFALRQVPMQFTDIVVSLQAGQSPMQVFLQQGGQLKDMFGGIGPAAKALSGYILGLINPFTVAAGTLGALGAAYYYGSEQSKRLENALISSSNIIGKTNGQLETLIETTGKVTGHYTQSREAVEALAASGVISGANLQTALRGVMAMSEMTGKSVEDLVPKFEEIAKDPVKAIVKLNEQYNFLTVDVYKQIKALEEQGKHQEAVTLAMTTFANTVNDRKGQVLDNVGYIEKAWRGVKSAIDSAKESLLGIGKSSTLDDQIKEARNVVNDYDGYSKALYPDAYARDKAKLADLERIKKTSESLAAEAGKSRADAKAKINQTETLDKYVNDSSRFTGAGLLAKQLADENKAFETATQGFSKSSQEYATALQRHQTAIENIKANANKGESGKLTREQDGFAKLVSSVKDYGQSLDHVTETGKKYLESETKLQALQEQLATGYKHISQVQKDKLIADAQANVAKEKAILLEKELQKTLWETAEQTQKQTQAEVKAAEDKQAEFNRMSTEYEKENADLNVALIKDDTERARAQVELEHQRSLDRIDTLGFEAEQAQALIDAETEHYNKELAKIDQNSNKSKNAAKELGLTFNSALENSILKGGKLGDTLGSLAQDIERVILRMTVIEPMINAMKAAISSSGAGDFFGNILNSIFGGSSGGVGYDSAGQAYDLLPDFVPANHTGGIVGLESTFKRAVNPAVFNGATRYHTGGIVGDEVPSILKRGEGVFTQEQMRNLAPVNSSAGNVTVNLIETSDKQKQGQVDTSNQDGNKSITAYIESIMDKKINNDIGRGRGIASVFEQTYGLNRAAGMR